MNDIKARGGDLPTHLMHTIGGWRWYLVDSVLSFWSSFYRKSPEFIDRGKVPPSKNKQASLHPHPHPPVLQYIHRGKRFKKQIARTLDEKEKNSVVYGIYSYLRRLSRVLSKSEESTIVDTSISRTRAISTSTRSLPLPPRHQQEQQQ